MKLKEVFSGIPVVSFSGNKEKIITEISYSSKTVNSGHMFSALKGEKTDGLNFVDEAVSRGAAAILSEQKKPDKFTGNWIQAFDARETLALCSANFFGHPSQNMKTLGITGTKGKTTVSYLIEEILKQAGFKPGLIGTIFYRGPGLSRKAVRTTPEAPDLQRMMKTMLAKGATHNILEISSHSLEMKRPVGIDFDVAIFTNLSGEHLDYHRSMEKYFSSKKKLFSLNRKSMAVINTDDPWGQKLAAQLPGGIITCSLESDTALVYAKQYSFIEKGIELSVKFPAGSLSLSSPLLGKPNIYNILTAVAAALTLKVPLTAIKAGIAELKGVPGRFEKIENPFGFHIFVDYAHTDNPLKNLLETARTLCKGQIILTFGAGGDRDKTKRSRMGKIAGKLSDWTIITSDNPRSEDPLSIISQIEEGIKITGPGKYEIQPDRKTAVKTALSKAKKGDYILIAGKGHEDYQITGNKTIHFDDKEVVREILKDMEAKQLG